MSTLVFAAVLFAAALHAVWNAIVKGGTDKRLNMAAVMLGHFPPAILGLLIFAPPAAESYPYIIASSAVHFGYQLFLMRAYQIGDLTQVYPIARGSGPMIVALFSVAFLGLVLTPMQVLAIGVILLGIVLSTFARNSMGHFDRKALFYALMTGFFIAGYSILDGIGARLSGSSVTYYGWVGIGNGIVVIAYFLWRAPHVLTDVVTKARKTFWIGGTASFAAYALVTWAFTQAPVALVTALRETSIVIALLIGVIFLGERLTVIKVAVTAITIVGVVLLRLGT